MSPMKEALAHARGQVAVGLIAEGNALGPDWNNAWLQRSARNAAAADMSEPSRISSALVWLQMSQSHPRLHQHLRETIKTHGSEAALSDGLAVLMQAHRGQVSLEHMNLLPARATPAMRDDFVARSSVLPAMVQRYKAAMEIAAGSGTTPQGSPAAFHDYVRTRNDLAGELGKWLSLRASMQDAKLPTVTQDRTVGKALEGLAPQRLSMNIDRFHSTMLAALEADKPRVQQVSALASRAVSNLMGHLGAVTAPGARLQPKP